MRKRAITRKPDKRLPKVTKGPHPPTVMLEAFKDALKRLDAEVQR